MAEDGADDLKRRAGAQHGRCGRIAKKTGAFGRGILDASPPQGSGDDARDRRGGREWAMGRLRSQENTLPIATWARGFAYVDIADPISESEQAQQPTSANASQTPIRFRSTE